MNTPTLSSAIAQERWDVAAHLLVYALIVIQTNGKRVTRPSAEWPDAPLRASPSDGQPEGI
jgi:hypothetical protein